MKTTKRVCLCPDCKGKGVLDPFNGIICQTCQGYGKISLKQFRSRFNETVDTVTNRQERRFRNAPVFWRA